MKIFQDYITNDFLNWLDDNKVKYELAKVKPDKGALNILYNEKFCLKIYDRIGHGFGVTINVTDNYDQSIYENDKFSLHWVFDYFKIKQTASFNNRAENQYQQNLPNLISDIKTIIPLLNQMTSSEWDCMRSWIEKEAMKQFS